MTMTIKQNQVRNNGGGQGLFLKNNSPSHPCLKVDFSKHVHVQTNDKIDNSRMLCKGYTGYKSSPIYIYQIWNTIYIYIYIYAYIYIHMHICIAYISRENKWVHLVNPSESKWYQVNPSEICESKWDQVSPTEFKWDLPSPQYSYPTLVGCICIYI